MTGPEIFQIGCFAVQAVTTTWAIIILRRVNRRLKRHADTFKRGPL